MASDFSGIYNWLDNQLIPLVTQGAAAGLDDVTPTVRAGLEVAARAKMRGQTGATFAGIVVYTTGAGVDSSGVFQEAVSAVRDLNPAHVYVESVDVGAGSHDLVVIGTVPTDYQQLLETDLGGDKAFLGEMSGYSQQLTDGAAQGIARVMR